MAINKAALDEAQQTPQKFGLIESIGGLQFILAQIFTIAATIIGVYLAGYVGFQRTLEYDRYVKAQQQSDLFNALHAELSDNTNRLREFVGRIDPAVGGNIGEWPSLRLFVWNAAGQTSSAFDIPPEALSGMQAVYHETAETLNNSGAREWFKTSNAFFTPDRTRFKEILARNVKKAETSLLPALQKAASISAGLIAKYSDAAH